VSKAVFVSDGPISVLAQKWGKEALFRPFWWASPKERAISGSTGIQSTAVGAFPPINTRASHYL